MLLRFGVEQSQHLLWNRLPGDMSVVILEGYAGSTGRRPRAPPGALSSIDSTGIGLPTAIDR